MTGQDRSRGDQIDKQRAPGGPTLTAPQRYRRAEAVVEAAGVLRPLEQALDHTQGCPRALGVKTLLALCVGNLLGAATTSMHLTDVHSFCFDLPLSQQRQLNILRPAALDGTADEALATRLNDPSGIQHEGRGSKMLSYDQLVYLFARLASALEEGITVPHDHLEAHPLTGEVLPCPPGCPADYLDATTFIDRLLEATIPAAYRQCGSYAMDSTDIETWARRLSRNTWVDSDPNNLPVDGTSDSTPIVDAHGKRRGVNLSGYPREAEDGRWLHCRDGDAREGWRSGKNGKRSEAFLGYDVHLLTLTNPLGDGTVPLLIRGAQLEPAGSHKGRAGTELVSRALARGVTISDMSVDRGYTYCLAATFADPMHAAGIELVLDLHKTQRGPRPPHKGVLCIDGWFFADSMPTELRKLPAPPSVGASAQARKESQAVYDKRQPYAFRVHTKADKDGYLRIKGPALWGGVRCPNCTSSMRRSAADVLTTNCTKGKPCSCAKTLTIPPTLFAQTRQRHLFGTTAWKKDYSRRSAVESVNAWLKTQELHIVRGYTRMLGLTKHTLAIGLGLVASNMAAAKRYLDERHLPDDDASPDEPPRPPRRDKTKKRTSRRPAPPGSSPPG